MNLGEIVSTYWYVLAIIVAILFFIWHSKASSYQRAQFKKIFSGKTLGYLLFFFLWWLWYHYGGRTELATANRWMPIFLALVLAGLNFIGRMRYETPNQLKTPNFHGSYCHNPYLVNGYLIFALDSYNAFGISWPYAKRIAIVRQETCELLDKGAVSIANMGFVSKYDLPEEVQGFIESNKHFSRALNSCYYGWFDDINKVDYDFQKLKAKEKKINEARKDRGEKGVYTLLKEEFKVSNPSVETLFWAYKNQSKGSGKQTEVLNATVQAVEVGVEHHKRVKIAFS